MKKLTTNYTIWYLRRTGENIWLFCTHLLLTKTFFYNLLITLEYKSHYDIKCCMDRESFVLIIVIGSKLAIKIFPVLNLKFLMWFAQFNALFINDH